MKLISFRPKDTSRSGSTAELLGAIYGDHVVNLSNPAWNNDLANRLGTKNPIQVNLLLAHWDNVYRDLPMFIAAADENDANQFSLDEIELLAPVPHPTSMRDGYAFRQHVEAARRNRGVEMIPEFDQFPVFYFTNHMAVTGPGEVDVMDQHLNKLDFELEAAIVIGRAGRNISAKDADEYIAGYTIMNDWSARALQMEEMKMSLGPAKGKDFATSIGPYLITRDELAPRRIASDVGERYDLEMLARVNEKEVSRGNLKDMTWTFGQIIERASYGVQLNPGDVIGSGTVGTGCFLELNGSKITDNWWLKDGDMVECEIEMLGVLKNTIRRVG